MKGNRQQAITEIIKNQIILTQDDLQCALEKLGYNVTQSTVSRDIKQLRLHKGHDADGIYRYISNDVVENNSQTTQQYYEIIKRSIISVDYALNDVVIKCYNGMASSVCVAIDVLFNDYMLGSVAGEDTILIVVRSENDAKNISSQISKML